MSAIKVWRAKKVLRRLISAWEEFGQVLSKSSSEEVVEQPVEKGILDLEARIAVDLPCMYELYTGTYLDDEIREEVRSVSELVKRYTGKCLSGRLSQEEAKGMMAEWNSHFVFMNKLLGFKVGARHREEEAGFGPERATRRRGALRRLGENAALRFVAKALVIIVLAVVVINLFGGPSADFLRDAVKKVAVDSSDTSGPGYAAGSIAARLASWQTRAQVFTAEHRSMITLGAIIIVAFAVFYLLLFRGS